MEAIKTEYRGIVFDSKSEAVFARALDLADNYYAYHPGERCGHPWDFFVIRHMDKAVELKRFWDIFNRHMTELIEEEQRKKVFQDMIWQMGYRSWLVEYKPKMPTNTYVDNLIKKMAKNPVESIVVWGNPWDGYDDYFEPLDPRCSYVAYPIFTRWGRYGWGDFIRLADNGSDQSFSYRHNLTEMLGITESIAQEAKDYRFDLA